MYIFSSTVLRAYDNSRQNPVKIGKRPTKITNFQSKANVKCLNTALVLHELFGDNRVIVCFV